MNSLTKASIIPTLLITAAIVGVQSFQRHAEPLTVFMAAPNEKSSGTAPALMPSNQNKSDSPTAVSMVSLSLLEAEEFNEKSELELQSLHREALLNYFLSYREHHQFDQDFPAKEYQMFQSALEFEPNAALDYMVAIGHDASSEFFYQFLYSDFMVHQGKADVVIDYINQYGATVPLMNLVTFANLEAAISPLVQRDILNEYIAGNAEYHKVIQYAQWDSLLTPDEKVTAFLATSPDLIEDPYDLISDIVRLENPATYAHLARFIERHPDRYRLYHAMKNLDSLDLTPTVLGLMNDLNQMAQNDQIQTALIALDFGSKKALTLLASAAESPLMLSRSINVAFIVKDSVQVPDYIDSDLTWIAQNGESLAFNSFTGKYEY